jgi:hypothetical protein
VDELNGEEEAAEKKQVLMIGSAEDRTRIVSEVQRLTETTNESQSKFVAISAQFFELEQKIKAAEANITGRAKENKNRLKDLRQEIARLRSARAEAERDLHQKMSDQNEAVSVAKRKAAEIAGSLANVERLVLAKNNAESCATEIRAGIEALDQKADELRQRQAAEALRSLQAKADNLLSDLSDFAKRNSSLVPLEIGPLVAGLKDAAAAGDDVEKYSKALASLQTRLDEVPEFKRFRESMEDTRQAAAHAELEDLARTARIISEFIESYVRKNITSDIVQDLLKVRASVSEALVTPESQALKRVIATSESEFDRLLITGEFHDYRAKHPKQDLKSLATTTDRNRSLVEGALDETLILVNESGRAGVVRNLRGDLVFDRGRASLCFPHENNFDVFALSEIKLKVREKGARTVDVSSAPCVTANMENYDVIAVNRGLFGTLAPGTATALLNAVDRGELSIVSAVSDSGLQIKRNAESIKSLQLENDILKRTVEGYGLVSIGNGSSVICQTAGDRVRAHEGLVTRSFDRLQVELKSSPSVISTSIESAFVSAKRGQCGAIYGPSKDLKDLITSLQRDKLTYHVLPIWFLPTDVEAEQNAIAATVASDLREQQRLEQKRKDDGALSDIERKQTEAEKTQRQERLRKENGVPARGLEEAMYAEVKAFASRAEYEDKTRVRQEWPALATWYRQGIKEQWELENVTSELRDYGVAEWKNRVLEVGFVAITFKMKHRVLGEHRQTCFILGRVADREFEVDRDPIAVPCEENSAINRYKTAHSFSSKWFAN